jgi:hypothetical protein
MRLNNMASQQVIVDIPYIKYNSGTQSLTRYYTRYWGKDIYTQYGEPVCDHKVLLYNKKKKYWIVAHIIQHTTGFYLEYHHQRIGEILLLSSATHLTISSIRTLDATYRGVGRALFQSAIETALLQHTNVTLNACWGSAPFHYKMGALPCGSDQPLELDILKSLLYAHGTGCPSPIKMRVEHPFMLLKWYTYISSHPLTVHQEMIIPYTHAYITALQNDNDQTI